MKVYALANQYGARVPTCSRHEAEIRKYLMGDFQRVDTDKVCSKCADEIARILQPWRVFQALISPQLSHTRFRPHFGGFVHIYHRDETSPTGVRQAASYEAKKFDAMYDACRAAGLVRSSASPLSPTEGR